MSVFKSSMKMAMATLISRILGLVREQVMAAYFGASGITDAFLVAYRIPNLLRDLFAEGAFSSAFVPTFIEVNQRSTEESRELLWSLFWLLFLMTGTISVGMIIFSPEIIGLFAPAFKEDPHKFQLTVNLTRIMAPFLVFVSFAALFMGVLNSLKVFFLPSVAPASFNILSISSMIFLTDFLLRRGYEPVYALGVGAILGGFFQAFIQLPILISRGYAPLRPRKMWNDTSKKIVKKIGPGLIGFAATQINLLVSTILATPIVGATSWLNYAFRLFQLPVGILSVSIGNSNLVHFSESWKRQSFDEAKIYLKQSFELSFFSVLPAFAILFCLSEQIVNIIFERGEFLRESTLMTALSLRFYALGLPFYGLYKILIPTFYALDQQRVPVITSLISIVFNILFCVLLTPLYGFKILAIGTTLSIMINSVIQCFVLKNVLKLSLSFFVSFRIIKMMISTLVTVLSITYLLETLEIQNSFFQEIFIQKIVILSSFIGLTLMSYVLLLMVQGETKEVYRFASKLFKKIQKK